MNFFFQAMLLLLCWFDYDDIGLMLRIRICDSLHEELESVCMMLRGPNIRKKIKKKCNKNIKDD